MQGTTRVPLALWLLVLASPSSAAIGDGGESASFLRMTVGDTASTQCDPENVLRACIMSDRPAHLVAVVHSVLEAAAQSSCVQWDIFTTDAEEAEVARLLDAEPLLAPPSRHSARVTTLLDAEAALEERGITPVWLRPAFKRGAAGSPRRTPWSLREPPAESDPKHSHPLNLLRFYIAELPSLEGDERVMLFDDDVCVRHDLGELFRQSKSLVEAPLLTASCQMQQYEHAENVFRIRNAEFTYADTRFLGTVGGSNGYKRCPDPAEEEEEESEVSDADCTEAELAQRLSRRSCAPAALEPKLLQVHSEISGRSTFHNETAWNFGVTLVHLARWRIFGMSSRMDRWFTTNEHFGFFAPSSMSFGLGIAYLAFAGQVECWPAQTVIDGLGFLNWNDMRANGLDARSIQVRDRRSSCTALPPFSRCVLLTACSHHAFASGCYRSPFCWRAKAEAVNAGYVLRRGRRDQSDRCEPQAWRATLARSGRLWPATV